MLRLAFLIPLSAYASLLYLAWSFTELNRCGASEGCLGYSFHFLMGTAAAIAVLITGSVAWILLRRQTTVGASIPLALGTLIVALAALVLYMTLGA